MILSCHLWFTYDVRNTIFLKENKSKFNHNDARPYYENEDIK